MNALCYRCDHPLTRGDGDGEDGHRHASDCVDALRRERADMAREISDLKERVRTACQMLVEEYGAEGPADLEDVVSRAIGERDALCAEVKSLRRSRDALLVLAEQAHGSARYIAELTHPAARLRELEAPAAVFVLDANETRSALGALDAGKGALVKP